MRAFRVFAMVTALVLTGAVTAQATPAVSASSWSVVWAESEPDSQRP